MSKSNRLNSRCLSSEHHRDMDQEAAMDWWALWPHKLLILDSGTIPQVSLIPIYLICRMDTLILSKLAALINGTTVESWVFRSSTRVCMKGRAERSY